MIWLKANKDCLSNALQGKKLSSEAQESLHYAVAEVSGVFVDWFVWFGVVALSFWGFF